MKKKRRLKLVVKKAEEGAAAAVAPAAAAAAETPPKRKPLSSRTLKPKKDAKKKAKAPRAKRQVAARGPENPVLQVKCDFKAGTWQRGAQDVILRLSKHEWVNLALQHRQNNGYVFHFLEPVAQVYPQVFESYKLVIERPMDLTTALRNLRDGAYAAPSDFFADVRRVFANCVAFNAGKDDEYSSKYARVAALLLRHAFDLALELLPHDDAAPAADEALVEALGCIADDKFRDAAWVPSFPAVPLSGALRERCRATREAFVAKERIDYDMSGKDKLCKHLIRSLKDRRHKFMQPFVPALTEAFLRNNGMLSYTARIARPFSVEQLDEALDFARYETFAPFLADARLIVQNALKWHAPLGGAIYADAQLAATHVEDCIAVLTLEVCEHVARARLKDADARREHEEKAERLRRAREEQLQGARQKHRERVLRERQMEQQHARASEDAIRRLRVNSMGEDDEAPADDARQRERDEKQRRAEERRLQQRRVRERCVRETLLRMKARPTAENVETVRVFARSAERPKSIKLRLGRRKKRDGDDLEEEEEDDGAAPPPAPLPSALAPEETDRLRREQARRRAALAPPSAAIAEGRPLALRRRARRAPPAFDAPPPPPAPPRRGRRPPRPRRHPAGMPPRPRPPPRRGARAPSSAAPKTASPWSASASRTAAARGACSASPRRTRRRSAP